MRIRTIKPEFWTSVAINSVSVEAQLLAVGLLNFADDEGWFLVEPRLIKAAVFPLRDNIDASRIATVLLPELSSARWMRTGTTPEGDVLAQITGFRQHQVINKPKPSILASKSVVWYEYGTSTVPVPPGMEGKGKEGSVCIARDGLPTLATVATAAVVIPPPTTTQEITAVAETQCLPDFDAQGFLDYNASMGWTRNGVPIRDWRHLLRKWHGNQRRGPAAEPINGGLKSPTGIALNEYGEDPDMTEAAKINGYSTWRGYCRARGMMYVPYAGAPEVEP